MCILAARADSKLTQCVIDVSAFSMIWQELTFLRHCGLSRADLASFQRYGKQNR